jgi:heme exporter protein A
MLTVHQLFIQRSKKTILSNCSFRLDKHALLFIQGDNGSGKTTLLRVIAGFSPPNGGEILWNNTAPRLGYLGHELGLRAGLTVSENLKLMAMLANTVCDKIIIQNLLEQVGLLEKKQSYKLVSELSFGQRKRVALAVLIIKKADIWLLDEPYTGLDKTSLHYISALIDKQLEMGSIILASHVPPHRFSAQLNLSC